jgi:hypothetical protein
VELPHRTREQLQECFDACQIAGSRKDPGVDGFRRSR